MYRDPDQALENLRNLGHRIHNNLAMSRLGHGTDQTVKLDTQLHNMTAQFIEQFVWLDEHLAHHGALPMDWRWATYRNPPKEKHG